MADLKTLKTRINSVKSTQKITKAMQMVSASKLRRAQERAEEARPFSTRMERMLQTLASGMSVDNAPKLLVGRKDGEEKSGAHLLIVATSDRGLCGAFNTSIVRRAKAELNTAKLQGRNTQVFTIGKKGLEQLRYSYEKNLIGHYDTSQKNEPEYVDAEEVARKVIAMFEGGEIDSCSIIYNSFISVLTQKVTFQNLIPLDIPTGENDNDEDGKSAVYEYEPNEEEVLEKLLLQNISVQIFHALIENSASVHGSRMTAMDNATRNAGDMIDKLSLKYNRTRQAAITTELTEIVAGAEAV